MQDQVIVQDIPKVVERIQEAPVFVMAAPIVAEYDQPAGSRRHHRKQLHRLGVRPSVGASLIPRSL